VLLEPQKVSTEEPPKNSLPINLGPERFPFMFKGRPVTINKIEMFLKIGPGFAFTHNETSLKLSIEPEANAPGSPLEPVILWNGLLRAVKAPNGDLAGELGNWILTAPGVIQMIVSIRMQLRIS
jgi:hypothetical protein